MEQEQQTAGHNSPKEPRQGAVLSAAEEGKKTLVPLLVHRGGKKAFLPPAAGHEGPSLWPPL